MKTKLERYAEMSPIIFPEFKTRDGGRARVTCWDDGEGDRYPILGDIYIEGEWGMESWTEDGRVVRGEDSPNDLLLPHLLSETPIIDMLRDGGDRAYLVLNDFPYTFPTKDLLAEIDALVQEARGEGER